MTLQPALDRLGRGFSRIWAKLRRRFQRGRAVTEGQTVTAQETETMLGLMAQANAAGAAMTDEQRLLLIQAAPGMRAREAVLLGIPNRSTVEENELHMIRREMAALEGRDAPPLVRRTDGGWRPQGLASLAIAGGIKLWMVLAFGWAVTGGFLAVQMTLKERIEDQRDEARRIAQINANAAESWRARADEYRLAVIDAAEVARLAAADLERERAARARAQERERRRQREIQNVLSGSDDAPAWRLRDDPAADGQSGAN